MTSAPTTVLFTSEAGLLGHPDKVADRIGDAVLDAHLQQDPGARVGCNALVARDLVVIAGQIRSTATVDAEEVARETIREIGYVTPDRGFDADGCEVRVVLDEQDPALSRAVGGGGAGDSAIVYGAACRDTPELMPLPVELVHQVAAGIDVARRGGDLTGLSPDGKIQATVRYECGQPRAIDNLVLSVGYEPRADRRRLEETLRSEAIARWLPDELDPVATTFHFRRDVGFEIGGPRSDCGLSGRKVVSDTYGGWARHGGGGLSGKDPSKIDRCGTYIARHIAKNLVAAGIAERCEIQIAYLIGRSEPVSVLIDFHGTGQLDEADAIPVIRRSFPLAPEDVIDYLDLRRPMYRTVGTYGHFGAQARAAPWESVESAHNLVAHA